MRMRLRVTVCRMLTYISRIDAWQGSRPEIGLKLINGLVAVLQTSEGPLSI